MAHQTYRVKDKVGKVRSVEVEHDADDSILTAATRRYVAVIRSQRREKMFDGSYRGEIIALGTANTPHEAADNAVLNLGAR